MIYGENFIMEKEKTGDRRIDSGYEGENRFVIEYQRVKSNSNLVCMPHFGRTDPDFLICSPKVGFMICEVKNVKLHNIFRIETDGTIHYRNQSINPWKQVKRHREACSDFIQSTYKNDLYRCVSAYVVFTNFTKSEFKQKFKLVLSSWNVKQKEMFFARFKFIDDIASFHLWNSNANAQNLLKLFDFTGFCEHVRPDFTTSPNHKINDFLNPINIDNRLSFVNSHKLTQFDLYGIWNQYQEMSKKFRFKRYYEIRKDFFESQKNNIEKNLSEIKTEIIKRQKRLSESDAQERELDKQVHIFTEKYYFFVSEKLNEIFEIKKKSLSLYIAEQYKWYNSITENVTQVAVGAALVGSKMLNRVRPNEKTEQIEKRISDIDLRTNIQKKFDSITNEEVLRNQVEKLMSICLEKYIEDWQEYLSAGHLFDYNKYEYQLGENVDRISRGITETQLAFVSGVTTTAMAAAGLAAGWHTMAYAVSNIVPAGLAITAGLTLVSALSSKGKRVSVIQNEVTSILENYRYAVRENVLENKVNNGMTIREWLHRLGEEIGNQVVDPSLRNELVSNILELERVNQILQNEVDQIQRLIDSECE